MLLQHIYIINVKCNVTLSKDLKVNINLYHCQCVYFSSTNSYVMKLYRKDDPWIKVIASEIKSICLSSVTHKFWYYRSAGRYLVGEPKSRILQNDKKIAPDFDMAEFLYIGSLINA